MAKKPGVAAQGLSALINLTSYLTSRTEADTETVTKTVRLPRISSEVLDYLSNLHGLPRKDLIALATTQLRGMTNRPDTLKALQEVANQFSLENARTRTLEFSQGSLKTLNELANRLGLSPDAVVAALLSIIGADLDILTSKRREQIQKALKVVEKLRDQADDAEAELTEILGAQHPIAWEKMTSGIHEVHEELRQELHNLSKKAPSTAKPTPTPEKPATKATKPRPKKAPAKAKPKSKAKPKTKTKSKPKTKAKSKTSTKKKAPAKRKTTAKKKPASKKKGGSSS